MSKDSVKPEIRFKEFEDSWEQIEVRKVAPLQRGFDLPKSKMIEGPYPVVFSNGIGGRNTEYKVKGPGVTTGRSGTIGNVTYVDEDYWPHNTSLWVTNFFENYPLYIFYLYQYMDLSKFGTGSGVPTLNRNDVHDYKVALPNPTEQTLISHFLNYIDNTLALHQREHTKLTNFKESMLQKMFPKEGETVPEVRFEGFDEEWDSIKIKDIITKGGSGGTPTSTNSSYYNGHIPFLSISDITNSSGVVSKTIKSITKAGLNNSTAYIVPKGSVSLAMYASVGKVALLDVDLATSQAFYNMEFSNSELAEYVYVYLSKVESENGWDKLISTGTQANLNAEKVKNYELKIPKLDEMFLIKNYFIQLDKLIYIKQAELTKLKQFKQAMLDKMFV